MRRSAGESSQSTRGGSFRSRARESAADVALGRVAVLPGLVNAHTHLELSYLHGRIPPASRFLDWVRPMLAARRERPAVDDAAILRAAEQAIKHARAAGTALIGDVDEHPRRCSFAG